MRAAPQQFANPIVGDNAAETVNRAKNVCTYLQFTADSYAGNGSSANANDGLVLILEAVVNALDAAVAQAKAAKGGEHA